MHNTDSTASNPTETTEIRRCPAHPKYLVSDQGDVFRELPDGTLRKLTPWPNADGYLKVTLGQAGEKYIHRVILETFIGPCPPGRECCHWNGDRRDNSLRNLRWGTTADQLADKRRHGTILRGEHHPNARLNPAKVRLIHALARLGVPHATIGRLRAVNVHRSTVGKVARGDTWAHVGRDNPDRP